jgi:hypothetical protein
MSRKVVRNRIRLRFRLMCALAFEARAWRFERVKPGLWYEPGYTRETRRPLQKIRGLFERDRDRFLCP